MVERGMTSMSKKMQYLLAFVVFSLIQVAVLWDMRSDFETVASQGAMYRVPVRISEYGDQRNGVLHLNFPIQQARWTASEPPRHGDSIYVAVAADEKGVLTIKGASFDPPAQGDYIRTRAWDFKDGVVDFAYPFQQMYMDKQRLAALPLTEFAREEEKEVPVLDAQGKPLEDKKEMKFVPVHEEWAQVRLLEGKGVVTDVTVDGMSVLNYYRTGETNPVQITPTGKENKA